MNTVIDQNLPVHAEQIMNSLNGSAANDDHLPGRSAQAAAVVAGGWDAHDVWRRLIKDARARRQGTDKVV